MCTFLSYNGLQFYFSPAMVKNMATLSQSLVGSAAIKSFSWIICLNIFNYWPRLVTMARVMNVTSPLKYDSTSHLPLPLDSNESFYLHSKKNKQIFLSVYNKRYFKREPSLIPLYIVERCISIGPLADHWFTSFSDN